MHYSSLILPKMMSYLNHSLSSKLQSYYLHFSQSLEDLNFHLKKQYLLFLLYFLHLMALLLFLHLLYFLHLLLVLLLLLLLYFLYLMALLLLLLLLYFLYLMALLLFLHLLYFLHLMALSLIHI